MRLFLLLCLFASALWAADAPSGVEVLPNGDYKVAGMVLRGRARELALPARFNLELGALEVIIARPGGRLHEALLVTDVPALQIQAMLYALGAKNGARLPGGRAEQGTLVDIFIEWTDAGGALQRKPVEHWMKDRRSGGEARQQGWVFVGSVVKDGVFMADAEGNVALNYSAGATVLDIPDAESLEDDTLHTVNADVEQPKNILIILKPRL